MLEHESQGVTVELNHPVIEILRSHVEAAVLAAFRLKKLGAHHGRQGQRHHGRDQDGDRQSHRELAEQAADDVSHKQQRNEHRDQGNRQRNDGESDLPGPFESGLERRVAFLQKAIDVLDHHDGVIHHKASRDRQRHQRKIV